MERTATTHSAKPVSESTIKSPQARNVILDNRLKACRWRRADRAEIDRLSFLRYTNVIRLEVSLTAGGSPMGGGQVAVYRGAGTPE